MKDVRVGVVGLGYWGPNLARNFARVATLAWCCDLSEQVRARYQPLSNRNASVVSAHTAGEIICVVCVAASDRPSAVAVALAVVADALRAGDLVPSSSR